MSNLERRLSRDAQLKIIEEVGYTIEEDHDGYVLRFPDRKRCERIDRREFKWAIDDAWFIYKREKKLHEH